MPQSYGFVKFLGRVLAQSYGFLFLWVWVWLLRFRGKVMLLSYGGKVKT